MLTRSANFDEAFAHRLRFLQLDNRQV
jgi:hypothetical protein